MDSKQNNVSSDIQHRTFTHIKYGFSEGGGSFPTVSLFDGSHGICVQVDDFVSKYLGFILITQLPVFTPRNNIFQAKHVARRHSTNKETWLGEGCAGRPKPNIHPMALESRSREKEGSVLPPSLRKNRACVTSRNPTGYIFGISLY